MTKRKGPTPRRSWQTMERAVPVEPSFSPGVFWMNDRYTAIVNELDHGMTWLSVRRNDRKPIRDWRDLQRVKNDITDPEREAFEMFPAESRLVDTVNQYHLWVLPEGQRLPVGWERRVVTDEEGQLVMDGRVLSDEEIRTAVESYGASPEVLAKTRQRPRSEEL